MFVPNTNSITHGDDSDNAKVQTRGFAQGIRLNQHTVDVALLQLAETISAA